MRRSFAVFLLFVTFATASADEPVTIFLAGDSTMAQKLPEKRPETGWGEFLQKYFDESKVRVENHAKNGRSTRTFIEEKLWQQIVERLKPGDYVFIQFGHNDQSKEKVDRYTSPEDFRHNLTRFVQDVRTNHATPVLLTPIMRRRFDKDGNFQDSHGTYTDIVRSVAAESSVALIDMHRQSERVIRECGLEGSKALFLHLAPKEDANYPNGLTDNTHFSPRGADLMARLAVEGIVKSPLGLKKYLKAQDAIKTSDACRNTHYSEGGR